MWCGTEEIGVGDVSNVQGRSMAQRMPHVVGTNSVHGSVQSSMLQATTWAWPINFGLGTNAWARGRRILRRSMLDRGGLASCVGDLSGRHYIVSLPTNGFVSIAIWEWKRKENTIHMQHAEEHVDTKRWIHAWNPWKQTIDTPWKNERSAQEKYILFCYV